MRNVKNGVKVYLTKEEVVVLAGVLGGMYGQAFSELYNELMCHLKGDDEKIAYEISQLLDQLVMLDEDNLYYNAHMNVYGTDLHK